jgi:hypothetical protein
VKKINLLLCSQNLTSFHQSAFQDIIKDYFNFIYLDNNPTIDQSDTLIVTSFTESNTWWLKYHQDGFRILMDNLWGIGSYKLDRLFLVLNQNWFWYHEALLYKKHSYNLYQPTKTYKKLALLPMGLIKKSHDLLYENLQNYLDDMYWSYVEKLEKYLPDDPIKNHSVGQRYFNPMWYDDTHFSMVSETVIDNHFDLHVTEKSYKPIAFYHPFLIFGQAGVLSHLRRQGFETFENLFDESYDNVFNIEKRLELILDNFKNYKKIPYDTVTLEKLSHNHDHFFNVELIKQRVLDEIVYPVLEWVETKQ